MKKILQFILKILAKLILLKYKPQVVGITGSVGKTSTKEAIHVVLSSKFRINKSIKNYNNEIGLPLVIMGLTSPGKNFFGWIFLFFKALKLIIIRDGDYPEILVLEMGIDRMGDMDYLNSITRSNVGVLTNVSQSHLEFFENIDNIKKEKSKLIEGLKSGGLAVINYDNKECREISEQTTQKVATYGFEVGADIRATEISFEVGQKIENCGTSFMLTSDGYSQKVLLQGVVGYSFVYSVLAGVAVGLKFGINFDQIVSSLVGLKPPKGRMVLLEGINNSLLIDDTYNSSPESSLCALSSVKKMSLSKNSRKIAVFGSMLELGKYSVQGHQDVGVAVANSGIDLLIVIGGVTKEIIKGAENADMPRSNIFYFINGEQAIADIPEMINDGDLILVKGSQVARMEKVVESIMKNKDRANDLLVRQGREWKD